MLIKLKHIANLCGNPIKEFEGTKRYYSTGNINTNNYELVSYKNRPSRANISVNENNILIAKMKNTNKTTIVSEEMKNYIFSTGFSVLESKGINNRYLYYLLESPEFIEKKDVFSVGTTQVSINDETLKNIEINYVDNIDKQFKIVNFLDRKVSEIDNIIEKTKETIEDYKKYKQSVITEAVTKGLDKNIEMKDTDIDWIEKIPLNWEFKRNKYVATSLQKGNGITKDEVIENGNIQCVRYGEIYSRYDNTFDDTFSCTNIEIINSPKKIEKGDILFAGTGELVEEIGKNILYLGNKECLAGGDIIVMKHNQNNKFINYSLNSIYSQEQKSCGKAKLKVVHISATDIGNIIVAIPPLEEQERIANYLDNINNEINKVILSKQKIIDELEQYKKSLIYEYVTGKKEVI